MRGTPCFIYHEQQITTLNLLPFRDVEDVSCLENEYQTIGETLQGPQPKSSKSADESDAALSDGIEEIVTKIKQRETKYRLDAAEQLEDASASDVMEDIKKRSKSEREDSRRTKRKMMRGGKRPATVSNSNKLEGILDQLPNFLASANRAAEAHTRALRKWKTKFGLSSSDTK